MNLKEQLAQIQYMCDPCGSNWRAAFGKMLVAGSTVHEIIGDAIEALDRLEAAQVMADVFDPGLLPKTTWDPETVADASNMESTEEESDE